MLFPISKGIIAGSQKSILFKTGDNKFIHTARHIVYMYIQIQLDTSRLTILPYIGTAFAISTDLIRESIFDPTWCKKS